jgi:hypothetical protein
MVSSIESATTEGFASGRTMTFSRWRLFGIPVASEVDLPLPAAHGDGNALVQATCGPVALTGELIFRSDDPEPFVCLRDGEAVVLAWEGARFRVTADRVVMDCVTPEAAAILLLHPVWSVLLAARGAEALHGCVVERAGSAIAIQGMSGTGKTTAGLALLDRGYRLVTDDLIIFDGAGNVVPGPPFLRLTPDRAIGRVGHFDVGGKLRFHAPCCAEPVPLTAMVVLREDEPACARLRGAAVVDALLTQVYNPILTHPGQARRRLELALDLANRVPVYAAPARSLSADDLERIAEDTAA